METARRRLPNRRHAISETMSFSGTDYTVTAGLDPTTLTVREVFISGAKEGSLMEAILGDAAVAISVALQHGVPAPALAMSMARVYQAADLQPRKSDELVPPGIPASPIGMMLDFIQRLQEENDVKFEQVS